MSQTAIPLEFEQYLQNKVSLGEPTDLNEIIFAMIPNLDLSKPIDRTAGLPPLEQWVYQQDVDQVGKSGINSVVYSVVIQGSQESFTFNAMFLRDKNVPDSCGMVVYKATETKEVSMALTKSMLMQFDGAASAANVIVDAATWQIDYQARLGGMDEEHRLACLDNYGHTAFVDGFDVTRHDVDQNKYLVAPGVAYVGGLRIQNALVVAHNVSQKPTTLWLDVYRDGTALSTHENQFKVVASTSDLVDYVDGDGLQHYVCKLAGVEADGSVVDWRVKGGLDEHVEDSDPHKQYLNEQRLMSYGLGVGEGTGVGLPRINDVDNLDSPTKFYKLDPHTPNNPLNDYGVLIHISRGSGKNIYQLALGHNPSKHMERGSENGVFTPWKVTLFSGDFGLGGVSVPLEDIEQIDVNGFYFLSSEQNPFSESGYLNRTKQDDENCVDVFIPSESGGAKLRRKTAGKFGGILELFDTENCQIIETEAASYFKFPNGLMMGVGLVPGGAGHSSYVFEVGFGSSPNVLLQGVASQTAPSYEYNNQWINGVSPVGFSYTKGNNQSLNWLAIGKA